MSNNIASKQRSLANLKPIQKGERRNLSNNGGRKKGLERIFKDALTKEELIAIIQKAKSEALDGNVKAMEFIFDRMYGKPVAVDGLLGNENRTLIQNNFNIDVTGKSASELIETLQSMQIESDDDAEILE